MRGVSYRQTSRKTKWVCGKAGPRGKEKRVRKNWGIQHLLRTADQRGGKARSVFVAATESGRQEGGGRRPNRQECGTRGSVIDLPREAD